MIFTPAKSMREKASDHAILGLAIVEFLRFELAVDEFVWCVAECNPRLAKVIRKAPPFKFAEKMDFIWGCVNSISKLRVVPMYDDGRLDFTEFFLMAEAVWELRKFIAHGAVVSSQTHDGDIVGYSLRKLKYSKPNLSEQMLSVGVKIIEEHIEYAIRLSTLIEIYYQIVKHDFDYTDFEKQQRVARDNRKKLAEFGLLPEGFSVDMNSVSITMQCKPERK